MRSRSFFLLSLLVAGFVAEGPSAVSADAPAGERVRVGMIGLDTSHVIAFTKLINDPKATGDLAVVEVVAGFPGGTDIPPSRDRVAGFTKQLRDMGVEIVDSIPELLTRVDAVMIESVDGRPHLEQAKPVFAAGKPLFIDKPLAGSVADAVAIGELGKKHGVPWFSSSSLRFSPKIYAMRMENDEVGKVVGCQAWSPCSLEPHHPDLFWYGVHGVEILFTIMGPGCETVTRSHTKTTDLVTGIWTDGRIGTYRGIRGGRSGYGATVFGTKGIAPAGEYAGYRGLVLEVAKFFRTGRPPVESEETIEMFAFMEAADESKRRGGVPVTIASVLDKARAEASEKLKE